jgi:hypothetical protein
MPAGLTLSVTYIGNQAGPSPKSGAPAANGNLPAVARQLSTAAPLTSVVGFAAPPSLVQTTLTPSTPPQKQPLRLGLLSNALSNQQQAPTEPRRSSTASHSSSGSGSGLEPSGSNMQNQGGNSGVSNNTQPIPIVAPDPSHPHYAVQQATQHWQRLSPAEKNIEIGKTELQNLLQSIAKMGIALNPIVINKLNSIWEYAHQQTPEEVHNAQEHLKGIFDAKNFCNRLIQQANASINAL